MTMRTPASDDTPKRAPGRTPPQVMRTHMRRRHDALLCQQIQAALVRALGEASTQIDVNVRFGVVRLRGRLASTVEVADALAAVSGIAGVCCVRNRLSPAAPAPMNPL